VALPTEQLCSVLLAPDIFQQNYNKVLELALRLVNKYAVADILLPALAENWRMEKWT